MMMIAVELQKKKKKKWYLVMEFLTDLEGGESDTRHRLRSSENISSSDSR